MGIFLQTSGSSSFSKSIFGSRFRQNGERMACSTATRLRSDWMRAISFLLLGSKDLHHFFQLAAGGTHLRLAEQESVEQPRTRARLRGSEARLLEEAGEHANASPVDLRHRRRYLAVGACPGADRRVVAAHALLQHVLRERGQAPREPPGKLPDALELGLGHLARPVLEQRAQQLAAVAEMPVEAALGDVELAGEALDAHRADAAPSQRLQAGREPLRFHRERLPYGSV